VKGFCEGVERLVEERVDLARGEEYNLSFLRGW
jgi:hypothetical protein